MYDKIPHLPGSRFTRSDRWLDRDVVPRLVHRARRGDTIVVAEKLDGSCVAVANQAGRLVPLLRSGRRTDESRFEQHRLFSQWVRAEPERFGFLRRGERVVGEWLAQAHGTRYDLAGRDPFVAFDLFASDGRRCSYHVLIERSAGNLVTAPVLSMGPARHVEAALALLGPHGRYGAVDLAEGVVYRLEAPDETIVLAKWVRPDKRDGHYVPGLGPARTPTWNWHPSLQSVTPAFSLHQGARLPGRFSRGAGGGRP